MRQKITALLAAVSSFGLLIVGGVIFSLEHASHHSRAEDAANEYAALLAYPLSQALLSVDRAAAKQALDGLRRDPAVLLAVLQDEDGELFARYSPAGRTEPAADSGAHGHLPHFAQHSVTVTCPVRLGPKRQGKLLIRRDLSDESVRYYTYVGIVALALSVGLAISLLVSCLLQRMITNPIQRLTDAARRLAKHEDYAIRAPKSRNDEIGSLIDVFNEMVAALGDRDEKLRDARNELEGRVKERTQELTHANVSLRAEIAARIAAEGQLIYARDAAEAASRAKSTFLANMSHELRTPLTAVLGYSEMILEDPPQGTAPILIADIQKIHEAGRHLLQLISDLLDLSKIEAGKMDLEIVELHIASFVDEVVRAARPVCDAKDNVLTVDCEDAMGTVLADRTRVRQILDNLLSNAAKFTRAGTISLRVFAIDDGEQPRVQFEVEDTGIGIPAEHLEDIFDPFVQGDRATSMNFGGSGLGLAISRQCADLMNGVLSVASRPNEGSTFTFVLPRDASVCPLPAEAARTVAAETDL